MLEKAVPAQNQYRRRSTTRLSAAVEHLEVTVSGVPIPSSVGVIAAANVGVRPFGASRYTTWQVGIWHSPDGWLVTATQRMGQIVGATTGIASQPAISNARSGEDLKGKFDQRGLSIGEGIQAAGDVSTGAHGIWVLSGGPGLSLKFPPFEAHSATTDTTYMRFAR